MSLARQTSRIWRLNVIALWALIATASIFAGLMLRDWTWRTTAPIRFTGDVANALNIGKETVWAASRFEQSKPFALPDWPALWKAYLGRYDAEYARFGQQRDAGVNVERRYRFDYPPGRLLIASAWAKHIVCDVPAGEARPRGLAAGYRDEFVAPLRWTNTGHESVAALGMFFLVRRVLLNASRRIFASELLAMLSALLLWFNPALILDAHGWPQWEAWVLPYTLWATYFALIDRWIIAGALIAIGAMLKGQVLMIAPIFPLWAIFSLRPGALLRFASGFFAMAALLMWPWLVRGTMPAVWVLGATLCFIAFLLLLRDRRSRLVLFAFAGLLGLLIAPFVATHLHPAWVISAGVVTFIVGSLYGFWSKRPIWLAVLLALVCCAFAICLPSAVTDFLARTPPKWLTIAMPRLSLTNDIVPDAGMLKIALGALCVIGGCAVAARKGARLPATLAMFSALTFLAALSFNGSFAWLHVGFQTERYEQMFMGRVCNLAAILQRSFGFRVDTPVYDFGLLAVPIALSTLLKIFASVGIGLCALALSIQVRRKDPNSLIPLAAAWTLLYALLPQMHERYLVWGAVVSAALVTRGVGGLLLHLVLTALQFSMILFAMSTSYSRGERFEALRPWLAFFEGLHPEAGYVVVTLAFVLLCWSFRRSVPKPPKPRKAGVPALLIRTPKQTRKSETLIDTADTSPASV